jgi:hypothetical protein
MRTVTVAVSGSESYAPSFTTRVNMKSVVSSTWGERKVGFVSAGSDKMIVPSTDVHRKVNVPVVEGS